MSNHNKLLRLYEGCIGVKTGFTTNGGRCLVSAAEKSGRRIVCVTLNAPDDWNDHISLYNSFFESLQERTMPAEEWHGRAYIAGFGGTDLYINEAFGAFLTDEEYENLRIVVCGPRIVYAPVAAGDKYGELRIFSGDILLFNTDIHYLENVSVSEPKGFWEKIFDALRGVK